MWKSIKNVDNYVDNMWIMCGKLKNPLFYKGKNVEKDIHKIQLANDLFSCI